MKNIKTDKQIKFNILIPTRNRRTTLEKTLELMDKCSNGFDTKLIVSSNNCSDGTLNFLKHFSEKNCCFSYIKSPDTLSMAENFERLIRCCLARIPRDEQSKTWVYLTGADDGLMRNAFEEVEKVIKQNPKIRIIKGARITYWWPDSIREKSKARISYINKSYQYKIRSTSIALAEVMNGRRSWFTMPFIYTGTFLRADLLAELFTGSDFYKSQIPDVYSMCEVVKHERSYIEVNKPIIISGVSTGSSGQAFTSGNIEKKNVFISENHLSIHKNMLFNIWPNGDDYPLYIAESLFASESFSEEKIYRYLISSMSKKHENYASYLTRCLLPNMWLLSRIRVGLRRLKYKVNNSILRVSGGLLRVVIDDNSNTQMYDILATEKELWELLKINSRSIDLVKHGTFNIIKKTCMLVLKLVKGS